MQIYFLYATRLSLYSCRDEFPVASIRLFCPGDVVLAEDELEDEDADMLTLYFPEEDAYADVLRFSFLRKEVHKGCKNPHHN